MRESNSCSHTLNPLYFQRFLIKLSGYSWLQFKCSLYLCKLMFASRIRKVVILPSGLNRRMPELLHDEGVFTPSVDEPRPVGLANFMDGTMMHSKPTQNGIKVLVKGVTADTFSH